MQIDIQLKLTGDLNVETANQLKEFMKSLSGDIWKDVRPNLETKPSDFQINKEGFLGGDAKKAEPAGENKKPEPEKKARKSRAAKAAAAEDAFSKPAEPAAEAKKEEKAGEEKVFTSPPGATETLKETEAAPADIQKAAKAKLVEFTPKEGEPVNVNYCRALLLYLATVKGMEPGRKLMEKYKVKKIGDLQAETLVAFIDEIKTLLDA